MRLGRKAGATALVPMILLSGCTGIVKGSDPVAAKPPEPPVGGPPLGGEEPAADARVRRLTATEIERSIEDVFLAGQPDEGPPGPRVLARESFDNQIANLTVGADLLDWLVAKSERAAAKASTRWSTFAPCDVAAHGEAACARTFITTVGRRTFRRPLVSEEITRLTGLYAATRKANDHATSLATVIEAMLQSPQFLFRSELGAPQAKGAGNFVTLTPYERASVLSYALWQSAPDDALLDAAEGGELATPDGLKTSIARMLADPRSRRGVMAFLQQWLEIDTPGAFVKDDPAATPAIRAAVVEQARLVLEDLVFTKSASWKGLLSSSTTFLNGPLAAVLGAKGVTGDAFARTTGDASKSAGLLTLPAFLAAHSPGKGSSPIFFGLFVRRRMLCLEMPSPPAAPFPKSDPNVSTRERYRQHTDDPKCRACHALIDPIGYGFERFDALGRYREVETLAQGTVPLSGEGQLLDSDVDGPFIGVTALAARLGESTMARSCFAKQMLTYLLGRSAAQTEYAGDERLVDGALRAPDTDATSMIAALLGNEALFTRDARNLMEAKP